MREALNQYFTPTAAANKVAQFVDMIAPKRVIDSNCGDGGLLDAFERCHPGAEIYGIDLDEEVVSRLVRSRPIWRVTQGDALDKNTWKVFGGVPMDAAVLNPPFSIFGRRGIQTTFGHSSLTTSLAMSHVLTTIHHVSPKVVIAILPESIATSDIDRNARIAIEHYYEVNVLERLPATTFAGVAANSFIVRMARRTNPNSFSPSESGSNYLSFEIIRGGLPVFQANYSSGGIPYIHSVDIRKMINSSVDILRTVNPIGRGLVKGHVILLPRVGIPHRSFLKSIYLPKEVQLSDCVIALRFRNAKHARQLTNLINQKWDDFIELYRGTGARYVTVTGIRSWLQLNHHEVQG